MGDSRTCLCFECLPAPSAHTQKSHYCRYWKPPSCLGAYITQPPSHPCRSLHPAAARAARELLSAATTKQTRTRLPVQQNFFTPEDEGVQGPQEMDQDVISEEGGSSSEGEDSSEGREGIEREEAAQGGKEQRVLGKRKRPAAGKVEESEEDAGYGAGGLSWEAVLSAVTQVCLHVPLWLNIVMRC